MYDFGKIKFIQEYEDQKIVHEIRGDSSLDEVVDAFELFLKGAGYHLKDGQHIGYEYDEDDSSYQNSKETYDRMQEDLAFSEKDTITLHTTTPITDEDTVTIKLDDIEERSSYYWDTERNR